MKRLSLACWNQILSYARAREREGWYYGNKEQFEKRHAEIMAFIQSQWPTTPNARSMRSDNATSKWK